MALSAAMPKEKQLHRLIAAACIRKLGVSLSREDGHFWQKADLVGVSCHLARLRVGADRVDLLAVIGGLPLAGPPKLAPPGMPSVVRGI